MKHIVSQNVLRKGILAVALCSFVVGAATLNAAPAKEEAKAPANAKSNADHKEVEASRILRSGQDLLEAKQEERGVKTLTQLVQQYPDTKAALQAELILSEHFIQKKQFDEAIKHLLKLQKVDDDAIQADALYKIGICFYNQGQYTQAFTSLRQVVNKFPGSVFANEAYYYIGLCHFRLNRWLPAVDALERVGTSIPKEELADDKGKIVLAESGQRLFVKIYDEDLIVMSQDDKDKKLTVEVSNENGDKEAITMEPLGKESVTFIGSVPMLPGKPAAGDGTLQVKGGDLVSVTYLDTHTTSGKTDQKILAKVKLVSTATVGFTNGNYEDYSNGALADQDVFMRVRDLDRDITPGKDTVQVTVKSVYKKEKPEDELSTGVNFEEQPEFIVRDTRTYTLTETEDRSGVFVGFVRPYFFDPETHLATTEKRDAPDAPVEVRPDDMIQIEYQDDIHMQGPDPILRSFKVPVLIGTSNNVTIQTQHIEDLEIKAKKNLIEGQLLLQLSRIFKEMGLIEQANKRAKEGLEKVEEVLKINAEAALERNLLEDAFNTKWELLIVQDKIKEAIAVCTTLIKTFPESALVDRALIKIAQIKISEGSDRSIAEGLNIYRGILQLPKSELKGEAQYNIALVLEELTVRRTKEKQATDPTYRPNYGPVMVEYKKCADNYPDSLFAGKSLEKIANFYIQQKDYMRVIEMMEQIFRDYPDADFLDSMLFMWAGAAFSLGRLDEAEEKCNQLISEYPNSAHMSKAQRLLTMVREAKAQSAE